jgi:hypothetical protein
MATKTLLQKALERMQYVNTVIPNLNSGGCGVFAHAMASELEHKGFKPKVAVLANKSFGYLEDDFVEEIIEHVLDGKEEKLTAKVLNDSGSDIAHMMVYLEEEDLYIDSEGVYECLGESDWSSYKHQFNMSVEHTGLIVSKTPGWNPTFNRKFIPKIYDIVFNAVNKAIKGTELQPQPLQLSFNF